MREIVKTVHKIAVNGEIERIVNCRLDAFNVDEHQTYRGDNPAFLLWIAIVLN